MFSLAFPVFRHLVRRSAYRSVCNTAKKCGPMPENSGLVGNNVLECDEKELDAVLEKAKYGIPKAKTPDDYIELAGQKIDKDITRKGINFTCECLKEMKYPSEQQWENLSNKLKSFNVENVSTKILQACIRMQKLDFGMSYYNYMVKSGQQLTVLDIMFFAKLLMKRKDEIQKYEKCIIELYHNIKDYLHSSPLIRSFIIDTFVEVPLCFYDIIKSRNDNNDIIRVGNASVIRKALELDMLDVAYDYINHSNFVASKDFIESYIQYCIRKVKEGKFSVDLINKFVKTNQKNAVTWNHPDLYNQLKSLVDVLMKHQNEYVWSVAKCEISDSNVCSNCNLALIPKPITSEEFERLKKHFIENVFIQKTVYLTSTEQELKRFFNFLNSCSPYNVVIDGLNVMYRSTLFGVQKNNLSIKYFLDKGFKVLTIARAHSEKVLTKGSFLKSKLAQKNAQFFFTLNSSEDDLFVIYAAMHGKLDTCFVTGDFYNPHLKTLDLDLKTLFLKWKMSHQFLIRNDGELIPPLPHCGLSQLTHSPTKKNKKYVWHISQQDGSRHKITSSCPLHWYCLQAVRKKKCSSH